MKARIATLAVVVLLLLTTGVLQGVAPAAAQPGGQSAVQNSMASGGNYRLISLEGEAASAVSSGGGYRLLQTPEALPNAGSGCCCTYLPCVLRQYP
jgi:hypothetical protein